MSQEPVQDAQSSGFNRRALFEGISKISAGLAATAFIADEVRAAPPPPEPKVEELEPFKYNLEAQTHWVGPGGSAKEATVEEFPVSQSIAGVSMRLEPGAIRELHWHALAAEWAYVLEGRCRTTVIAPNGQAEVDDFEVGDIWYFPKGHGHAIQNTGPGPCHFLLVFDNGHFSEFGTFGASDWIAHTPPHILSRNLGLPEATFAKFPKKELYIGPGAVPPAIEDVRYAAMQPSQSSHKFKMSRFPARTFPGGEERVITVKEFPIQTTLCAVRMDLQPGALREMHWHPHADEWQYFVKGRARISIFGSHGRVKTEEFSPGHVGFIKQGYGHYIEQIGNEPTQILIMFNSGEYQELSLSNWLGGNPNSLLTTNFGIQKEDLDKLPRREVGILGRRG
jgi:oxalate decarboxylase